MHIINLFHEETQRNGTTGNTLPHPKPVVMVNRPLHAVADVSQQILEQAYDPPQVFIQGGRLVHIRVDEQQFPHIVPVSEVHLRDRLSQVAAFVTKEGDISRETNPPKDMVKTLLERHVWGLPALKGITETPVLRPDGAVLSTPGYDPATQLAYLPSADLRIPAIPETPGHQEVIDAMSFVMAEVLCDFPFVDDGAACSASQANACALLLTPMMRPLLGDGRVPLAVLDKPQQGTGASLLAEIMSTIATGRPAAMMSSPRSHAEWRKRITALLAAGVTVVTIDNVDDVLDAPSLAAVLTAKVWSDRPLGRTKIITVPHHATWMATGNNVRLRGDLPRRCYWIRLNAKSARPWQRDDFRHPDLLGWVYAHRGDILAKLLTIARGWVVAGRPEVAVPPLGGFETWAQTLAGILAYAGVPGFLHNLDRLYTEQDHEIGQWSEFLHAWQMLYGAKPMLLSTVVSDLRSGDAAYEDLRHALPDVLHDDLYSNTAKGASRLQRRLGNGFKKFAGRYFDLGLHLEKAGQLHRATRWQVLQG